MLTPTVANRTTWLYAIGNTPATNLARCIPHGQDADLLLLGCGDVRNILFTAYTDSGLPTRKLDITCCDVNEKILARNIVLLTLLLDDGKATLESLWDIYYHLYLDEKTAQYLLQHVRKLLPMFESLNSWESGPYGSNLRICDQDTLKDIQKALQSIASTEEKLGQQDHIDEFSKSLEKSKNVLGDFDTVLTGLRSAAPLSMKSTTELPKKFKQYWTEGTVLSRRSPKPVVPNPMFSGLVSKHELLHYGSDPLIGFHLATAFADLTEQSPLNFTVKEEINRVASAARAQFSEWVEAFKGLRERISLRFVVSDALALCHTLQLAASSGNLTANWYRRQWDSKILSLGAVGYGKDGTAPVRFDAIDTSNLSDHLGLLNLIVSAVPLLKSAPWATLNTEQLIKREDSQQQAFDNVLCGPSSVISLLLGITSLQYWTNANFDSHVDELFLGILGRRSGTKENQLRSRLAWKSDRELRDINSDRPKLHIEPKSVAKVLFDIYLQMFRAERLPTNAAMIEELRKRSSGHFHRTSFVALIKLIQSRVKTDWPAVFINLLNAMPLDRSLALASNQMQELCVQLHLCGIHTEPWLLEEVNNIPSSGPLKGWKNIPPAAAVTLQIPRAVFDRLFPKSGELDMAAPTLVGSLKSSLSAASQWHNMFMDVHVVFGNARMDKHPETGDDIVKVEEDIRGWLGSSSVVATFVVPTAALLVEPQTALVGIQLSPISTDSAKYIPIWGSSLMAFETRLGSQSEVFISKLMPGQTANKTVSGGLKSLEDVIPRTHGEGPTKISAELGPDGAKITTLTGHVDICSEKGTVLLKDRVPIELQQKDVFTLDIVFGKSDLVCSLRFPVPVTKAGSRTRIARKSGYIEVIAPLAEPSHSDTLNDFISPTVLTSEGLPATLNAQYINIDSLPILDTTKKSDLNWLTTLTSLQFSVRERRLRTAAEANQGISDDARVNFKESLFTMFMLSSGLQGGQTGLFKINNLKGDGTHMMIVVSALRLDSDAASVVLDAAAILITRDMIDSGRSESFLLLTMALECCTITVNDAELRLWKKLLPSLIERCRSWNHGPSCEYRQENTSVPMSLTPGEKVICSCGNGIFPDGFVTIPEWDAVVNDAVRIAISPLYAAPFVEDVVDKSVLTLPAEITRCANCGKEQRKGSTVLFKCMRCEQVKYCSRECQREDWKRHRPECV